MAITQAAPLDQVGMGYKSQIPVAAGAKIFMGQFVAVDADGFADDPSGSLKIAGVAESDADNSAAGAADGDCSVNVLEGLFWRPADGTNTPAQTDVGEKMYAKDNFTVSKDSGDGPLLGILYAVDDELGCLVRIELALSLTLIDAT